MTHTALCPWVTKDRLFLQLHPSKRFFVLWAAVCIHRFLHSVVVNSVSAAVDWQVGLGVSTPASSETTRTEVVSDPHMSNNTCI